MAACGLLYQTCLLNKHLPLFKHMPYQLFCMATPLQIRFCGSFTPTLTSKTVTTKGLRAATSKVNAFPICCRTITQRTSSKQEEKFRQLDKIPPNYELVYKAPMDTFVNVAQGITTLSMAVLLAVGIYKVATGDSEFVSSTSQIGNIIENNEQLAILIAALILANIGVRNVVSNYPLRIYRRNNQYKAVFTGQLGLPFITSTIDFKSGEVEQIPPNGVLPWRESKYFIGKKKVFLLEEFFRVPAELTAMMK